jgi:hypothetical protein
MQDDEFADIVSRLEAINHRHYNVKYYNDEDLVRNDTAQ